MDMQTDIRALEAHRDGPIKRISLVTETFPPEVNGVAMTTERMLDGLARHHCVELVRVRQSRHDSPPVNAAYTTRLMRGIGLPRYAGLRLGLPATGALVRHWRTTRPDLVHVVTEGPLGWSAVRAAQRLGIPVTSDFHTNFHSYSGHYGVRFLRGPVLRYLRQLHNRTLSTLVPTLELASQLAADGFENLKIVSRGVDTERFKPTRRSERLRRGWGVAEKAPSLAPLVMVVSRVAPEKNFELAIEAFRALQEVLPEARMVIVGDGPARAELAQRNPDIHFAGMQQGTELAEHYASADLFLFPSQTETFGNVTLEAMASGLPVVAYDYAAAREHIRHGENGMVAPFGDSDAFIAQVVLTGRDMRLRQRIGAGARETAEQLDWAVICHQFETALLEHLEVCHA